MKYVIPALGVLFVGIKLTGHITWSWWFVLLPFYGGAVVALVLLLVFLVLAYVCEP